MIVGLHLWLPLARFTQNSSFRIFHGRLKCAGFRQINVASCAHLKVYFCQRGVSVFGAMSVLWQKHKIFGGSEPSVV